MQLGIIATVSAIAWSQTLPPRVFFSDLESGPNAGGENNGGAYVTLYGRNFGSTRATSGVMIGGGAATAYPIWSDTKITVQLGSLASTGNIVVTTAVGASNSVSFTVRTGNIFFAATNGSDSNAGSFASPWRTVLKARDTMQAGDITYARDGVSQTTEDGQGWNAAMLLRNGGTAGRPKALIAYPGAIVTIGNINGPNSGIRSTDSSAGGGAAPGYWVFAGLLLRGKNEGMVLAGPSSTWRVVGNDFTCPNGNGASACFETSQTSGVKFLGNNVHDTGIATASALYHGVYFSTDSSHIEMGWSKVSNVHGCRGVQIHSSPLGPGGSADPTGYNQYDISIHDNVIHDTQCDGIVIATVDPSKGKVEVYNNVVYNAGKGPANAENSGNWSCIYVTGTTNNGPAGSGIVELYNNTLYNCGTYATPPWGDSRNAIEYGGGSANIKVRIRNNIIYQPAGVPYLTVYNATTRGLCSAAENCDDINGSNNLFFGNGAAPLNTNLLSSISSDPAVINLGQGDFHLTSASPAVDTGTNTGTAADMDGSPRPQGAAYDVGALEYVTGTTTDTPPALAGLSCPANVNSATSGTCTVTLTKAASSGGFAVSLSSSNAALTLAASVTVASGATSATFTVTAGSVSSNQAVTVTASSSGVVRTASVTIVAPTSGGGGGGFALRVNAGGPAYTDAQGNVWSGDTGYAAGSSFSTAMAITGTTTPALYQTERWNSGTLTYQFSVPNGNYNVNLKFAEIYFSAPGGRVFNVAINGQTLLTNFDIVVAAGGSFKAIDKQFPISVSNGGIGILLTGLVQNPKISAIEITTAGGTVVTVSPATATLSANQSKQFSAAVTGSTNTAVVWSMTPSVGTLSSSGLYTAPASITSTQAVTVKATSAADSTKSASAIVTLQPPTTGGGFAIRVNAGGSAYTDTQGTVWSADAGYNAGSSYSATTAVTGTTTPTLYQTERWTNGTLTYQFSVPNGNYNVNLKFAEIYFSAAGNRTFNVVINGQALLTNFDIVAAAGGAFKAVDRQFPISVSTGSIITQLTPLIENPKISAIEITALQ